MGWEQKDAQDDDGEQDRQPFHDNRLLLLNGALRQEWRPLSNALLTSQCPLEPRQAFYVGPISSSTRRQALDGGPEGAGQIARQGGRGRWVVGGPDEAGFEAGEVRREKSRSLAERVLREDLRRAGLDDGRERPDRLPGGQVPHRARGPRAAPPARRHVGEGLACNRLNATAQQREELTSSQAILGKVGRNLVLGSEIPGDRRRPEPSKPISWIGPLQIVESAPQRGG